MLRWKNQDDGAWIVQKILCVTEFLSFVVDDSEGAAGVEDSSVHLQLEKR